MRNQVAKPKSFAVFGLIFLAVCVVGGVVLSAKRQAPRNQFHRKHPKDWLASVPPVSSKVKHLEIINARVVRAGTDIPGLAFEISNKSDRAVMAVRITCGSGGLTKDGLDDEDNPVVVIQPHGVLPAEMNDELTENAPIVISAATFADGSKEGDEASVEFMQKTREHARAQNRTDKERHFMGKRPQR